MLVDIGPQVKVLPPIAILRVPVTIPPPTDVCEYALVIPPATRNEKAAIRQSIHIRVRKGACPLDDEQDFPRALASSDAATHAPRASFHIDLYVLFIMKPHQAAHAIRADSQHRPEIIRCRYKREFDALITDGGFYVLDILPIAKQCKFEVSNLLNIVNFQMDGKSLKNTHKFSSRLET